MEDAVKKAPSAGRLAQEFVEIARGFTKSDVERGKKSEKLAWGVAICAVVASLIWSAAAWVAVYTRPEPEPVLIRVNDLTGDAVVAQSSRDAPVVWQEIEKKHWAARYITTCESYDWFTISDQFAQCKLMASGPVFDEYSRGVNSDDGPLAVLKDKGRIVAKVTSIVFVGDGLQVRYTLQKVSPNGDVLDGSPLQRWIGTMVFEFDPRQKMTEQQRLVNPLGMRVLSFRRDPEALS